MLSERKVGYPSVHAEADFTAPLRFGDTARVVLETLDAGHKALTCRYHFFNGDSEALCATVTVVMVAIDMDTFTGQPLPEDVKAAFHRHRAA